MSPRGKVLLVVLLAALAAGGCGRSRPAAAVRPAAPPTASPTPPSRSVAPSPSPSPALANGLTVTMPARGPAGEQTVLAGYQAFWVGLLSATKTADPLDPGLVSGTTGTARQFLVKYVGDLRRDGQTHSGKVRLAPTVASMSGGQAVISDCANFAYWRTRGAGGAPVDTLDLPNTRVRVAMVRVGARWVAATYQQVGRVCRPGI